MQRDEEKAEKPTPPGQEQRDEEKAEKTTPPGQEQRDEVPAAVALADAPPVLGRPSRSPAPGPCA